MGLIGFLIAYILHPLVDWLNRRLRFKRPFAVIFTYTLLLLLFAFGSIVITQVVQETGRFINLIPAAMDKITDSVQGLQNSLAELRIGQHSSLGLGVCPCEQNLGARTRGHR